MSESGKRGKLWWNMERLLKRERMHVNHKLSEISLISFMGSLVLTSFV
jgi:hypothetical protein